MTQHARIQEHETHTEVVIKNKRYVFDEAITCKLLSMLQDLGVVVEYEDVQEAHD